MCTGSDMMRAERLEAAAAPTAGPPLDAVCAGLQQTTQQGR